MKYQNEFQVEGTTVYALEFDSWRNGKEVMRNNVYAGVQGHRDTPKEELEATAKMFAIAPKMADLLDDLINTLANYRLLQKRSDDPIGAKVTFAQIQEIKTLLIKAGYNY